MKVTIVGKQEWTTQDRKTGEEISGLSYICFLPNDKAIKFTSQEEYPVHLGLVGYDEKQSMEVELLTSLFGGEVKYKDGASYGKKSE